MNAAKSLFGVLVLASAILATNALLFKDCGICSSTLVLVYILCLLKILLQFVIFSGSVYGKVRTVAVSGCETSNTCILRSGQSANLTVQFTSRK